MGRSTSPGIRRRRWQRCRRARERSINTTGRLPHRVRARDTGVHRWSSLSLRSRRSQRLPRGHRRASGMGERRRTSRRHCDARPAERRDRGAGARARLACGIRRRDRGTPHQVKLPALGLMLGSAAGLVAATQPLSDTDMWWHLATGRETLAHGLVRADIFSWTVNGTSVPTDQWFGQVVMYAAYALLGWWGIALVRVISVVALISLVAINASVARSVRPLALALATLPALL